MILHKKKVMHKAMHNSLVLCNIRIKNDFITLKAKHFRIKANSINVTCMFLSHFTSYLASGKKIEMGYCCVSR